MQGLLLNIYLIKVVGGGLYWGMGLCAEEHWLVDYSCSPSFISGAGFIFFFNVLVEEEMGDDTLSFLTGSISKPVKEFPIESYYSPNIHLEIFVLNTQKHVVFIFFILFWGGLFGTEMLLQPGWCRFRFF